MVDKSAADYLSDYLAISPAQFIPVLKNDIMNGFSPMYLLLLMIKDDVTELPGGTKDNIIESIDLLLRQLDHIQKMLDAATQYDEIQKSKSQENSEDLLLRQLDHIQKMLDAATQYGEIQKSKSQENSGEES